MPEADADLPLAAYELALQEYEVFAWRRDSGGVCYFDVTRLRSWAERHLAPSEIAVQGLAATAEAFAALYSVDTEKAATADLSPPILAVCFEEKWLLIDGAHRVYRALCEGVERLPAYLIEPPEVIAACLRQE